MKNLTSHLQVFIATVLVAGSFIAAERLADTINPVSLTLLRFICAILMLAPFVMTKPERVQQLKKIMPRSLVIGLFYTLYFLFMFEALKTTTTLKTGALYTLVPFVTALLCIPIFGEKIGSKRLITYLIATVGALWVIFEGNINKLLSLSLNYGDAIFIVGSLSMCFYTISLKKLYRGDDKLALVFCTLIGGCVWMIAAMLILELPLDWHKLNHKDAYSMAYLVVGATLMTMYLYQYATIALGPRKVMAYVYLNPALVAVLSYLVNGEAISTAIIPGILFSAMATVLLQKEK